MAGRKAFLSKRNDESIRARIKTALLVETLQADALGTLTNNDGELVELSEGRRKSALGLLRKTLPDLAAVELSGSVTATVVARRPLTEDEWAEKFSGDDGDGAQA